jgi:aflatoxin B1 aldehyde reductase
MESSVLGTMNIEYKYSSLKSKNYEVYKSIIKRYFELNNDPILDTAYYYGNTKTEEILGNIFQDLNTTPKIATKANPWYNNDFTNGILGQLSPSNLENQLNTSLKNLKLDKVDIFYLHCPDYETDINETLNKCDELRRREKFDFLGVSNFSNEQLKEVLHISDIHGYAIPKYYQGMYNLICRKVEEIFPLLNENNMEFWAYNPLAGGLLTGRYKEKEKSLLNSSRFKDNKIYQNIFWKDEIFDHFNDFFQLNNCTEISFQWLKNYSKLRNNDKIIIGSSTVEQLDNNMEILQYNIEYSKNFILKYFHKNYLNIQDISPKYYY